MAAKEDRYNYDPSLPAAGIFAFMFLVSTSMHAFHMVKFRTWYWIPFVIGGSFECLGYLFRALSAHDKSALGPYIAQTLLILLAPALCAASIYMVLGRIIAMLPNGERYSMIRHNWMTKIFVGGDVISFLMQGGGGGILGGSKGDPKKQKMGENLIVGGLCVQLIFFGFFMFVSGIFWRRYHKGEVIDKAAVDTAPGARWRLLMKVLFASSLLILIRSIFRVIEYVGGQDGYLLQKEVFLYVFDSLVMLIVMVVYNWCFPGNVVRKKKEEAGMEGGYSMNSVYQG